MVRPLNRANGLECFSDGGFANSTLLVLEVRVPQIGKPARQSYARGPLPPGRRTCRTR